VQLGEGDPYLLILTGDRLPPVTNHTRTTQKRDPGKLVIEKEEEAGEKEPGAIREREWELKQEAVRSGIRVPN
jgi:hypothetical protein